MFEVLWSDKATQELASLWLGLEKHDRDSVNQALNTIEKVLNTFADDAGESRRTLMERVLFNMPIGILYAIKFVDRKATVYILNVWLVYKPAR